MPDDSSRDDDTPRKPPGPATDDGDGDRDSASSDEPRSDAAQQLEKKLEMIGTAALATVTMALRSSLARGDEEGLSEQQRLELTEVREKLLKSLQALDLQSEQGGIGGIDLEPLRSKIVQSIRELDDHLLPDHPGQQSGAHEVLPS